MLRARKKTKRVSAEKVRPVQPWAQPRETLPHAVEKMLLAVPFTAAVALLVADWPLTPARFLGAVALVGVVHFLFSVYAVRFEREVFLDTSRFVLVLVLVLFTAGFMRMTAALEWWSPFFIPLSFVAVVLAIVFNQRFAVEVTGLLLLYLGLCLRGYDDLLKVMITLFAGALAGILLSGGIRKRSRLVSVGVMIGAAHVVVLVSLALFMGDTGTPATVGRDVLRGFLHGVVVGFLLTGFLPLFETLLGVVTEMSLLELSNQNEQPLLRKLLIEAPGTHHHSFVVGILSEAAAEAVGANALLCRVGAYFHDIGKLNKPEYFIENSGEAAVKHNLLNPEMSTLIITAHTKDGLEMAEYYGLPKAVQAFITEHHGTSTVEYFYREALARSDGETRVSRDAFRYPGPRPRSRETAIVMLADSVEAATRSLVDPTPGRIQAKIHEIVMGKLADTQLDECPLTVRDLRRIEDAFLKVAVGIFHKRPELPRTGRPGEGAKGAAPAAREAPAEEGVPPLVSGKAVNGGGREPGRPEEGGGAPSRTPPAEGNPSSAVPGRPSSR